MEKSGDKRRKLWEEKWWVILLRNMNATVNELREISGRGDYNVESD